MCLDYVSCIATQYIKTRNEDLTTLRSKCDPQFNSAYSSTDRYDDFSAMFEYWAKTGRNVAEVFLFDKDNYKPIMSDAEWGQVAWSYGMALHKECLNQGYCTPCTNQYDNTYYLNVIGFGESEWNFKQVCKKCPGNGKAVDSSGNWGEAIISCNYDVGDTFSDETGSGEFTGQCFYVPDSENPLLWD